MTIQPCWWQSTASKDFHNLALTLYTIDSSVQAVLESHEAKVGAGAAAARIHNQLHGAHRTTRSQR